MKQAGMTVLNVGDAVKPRNLHAAVKEGTTAGLGIDKYKILNPNNALADNLPIDIAEQILR
jgi:hypothetical protein